MKKILVVGAGLGQLPAILAARQMGLWVVVVDRSESAPGMTLADTAFLVDVADLDGVLEVARRENIDGILTLQSDLPVPTVGYVNDSLGLHGISQETAELCSHKGRLRERLAKVKGAQPKFAVATSLEEASSHAREMGFPCVIKAPDSSGSRGVVKVVNDEMIASAYLEAKKFARDQRILVEEYVEGLEFGAQTFSVDGKCVKVLLHNDTMSPPPYMIPTGHSFPFKHLTEAQRYEAIETIQKAVEAAGIDNGPANIDLILDKRTNEAKIIEIGARIGATCLPELVTIHTGIDWVKAAILSALGEVPDLEEVSSTPVAAIIIEAPEDGVFVGYSLECHPDELGVVEYEITCQSGQVVNRLRKGTDRIGKVITVAETVNVAEANAETFRQAIKLKVTTDG